MAHIKAYNDISNINSFHTWNTVVYVKPDRNNLAAVFNNYNKTSRPKNELTLPTDHSDIHTRLHLQGTTYATTPTNVQAMITLNYTIQYKMDTKAAAKTRAINGLRRGSEATTPITNVKA